MPSEYQKKGIEIINSLIPPGVKAPDYSLKGRRDSKGMGISFVFNPHPGRANTGEYVQRVHLPSNPGIYYDAAMARIKYLVNRWFEIENAVKLYEDEIRECDTSEDGEVCVENDMPIPSWRYHVPAPLRRILDLRNVNEEDRLEIVDWRGSKTEIFEYQGYNYLAELFEPKYNYSRMVYPFATVRILKIMSPDIYYSQGITKCYIKIKRQIPDTILTSLPGLPLKSLVHIPGLDIDGINIDKIESVKAQEVEISLTRTMSMLSALPEIKN